MNEQFERGKVTVLIPVYNEERFLRQALESVVNQVDCVIIGDNASTDATEKISREFAEKYQQIRYERRTKNLGAVVNFSRSCEAVKTEYMLHMGGHDMVPEGYVSALKDRLNAFPDAIAAFPNVDWIDSDNKVLLQETFDQPNSQNKKGRMIASSLDASNPFARAANYVFGGYPANLLFGLYRTSSAFPEWLNFPVCAGADQVLLFRLLLKGSFIHCPQTRFLRRVFRGNDNFEKYMLRMIGSQEAKKSFTIDYQPMVDLMKNSFLEKPCEPDFAEEKKKLYVKFMKYLSRKVNCRTGLLLPDSIRVARNFLNTILKPWKLIFTRLKSLLIPGYIERKKKQRLLKHIS